MSCGCTDTTPCGTPDCGCKFEVEAGCVRYTGESLGATDIVEGDTLDTILKTLNTKFEEYGPGDYIELEDEAAGENCTYGGVKIILRDGDDDTIKSTKYICGVDATATLDGSGTANTIAMWTPDGDSLGNSIITQNGSVATIGGTLKITGGTPGLGKFLMSDADGDGSWKSLMMEDITDFGNFIESGSGTLNTIPLWTPDGNSLGNSIITQSGTTAIIGGTIKITGGSPATGKYLKSDADGDGSWSTITESDITGFGAYVKTDGTTPLTANWNAGSYTITSNKIVSTTDATVNGLTVGKGLGSIATNTALGVSSLSSNTTGAQNTAIGNSTLFSNSTSSDNTAIGDRALYSATSGPNTAIGARALYSVVTGTQNTAIGRYAGFNTTSSSNIFIGSNSGFTNTTGTFNIAIGVEALNSNITGSNNTMIGHLAGKNTTTANNSFVGSLSGYANTTGSNNSGIGYGTLYSNTTGTNNTAVGLSALSANTTGAGNTALGAASGYNNTTGTANTSVGQYSLYQNTVGTGITAIGTRSLEYNTSGNYNTAVGHTSLYANLTGSYNTGLGFDSLTDNTTGSYNTAVGHGSAHDNLSGVGNSAFGYHALISNQTTSKNSAFGYNGLASHEVGEDNTVIGYNAGNVLLDGVTPNTGNTNNIFIGAQTRSAALTTSNEIVIGAYAIGNGDNTTTIGTTSTTAVYLHGNLNLKNTTAVTTAAVTQTKHVQIVINGNPYKLLLAD